jgi:hypothetical protein
MGLSNRVLIDGEGRVVVAESGQPQITNDGGGSCCCNCPESLPNNMADMFTGLNQDGNLFFTDEAVKPYPFDFYPPFPARRIKYSNHEPAPPYSAEQLESDNDKYQLIAVKSGQGQNGGATNVLMWNGDDTLSHPFFFRVNPLGNSRQYRSNIGNDLTRVKPSIVDNGFANYSPNDATKGWTTKAAIAYHDDTTSHGMAKNKETGQDEKPDMGFPIRMGIYTGAPLHRFNGNGISSFAHPATDYGFGLEVSDFSYALPVLNSDFVQGGSEPYLLFPYVQEFEQHLKTVKLRWPLMTGRNDGFGRFPVLQQETTLRLPVRSGDELQIEVIPTKHEAGAYQGKFYFCVRFLINGIVLATEEASTISIRNTFPESSAATDPIWNFYCSFGHGVTLNSNGSFPSYFTEWNKWAAANNPNFRSGNNFLGGFTKRWLAWPQDNIWEFGNESNFKRIYVPSYAPIVGGFTTYNHTMQNEPLDFNCGVVNEPDPVVMQNFADATGRTIDAPPPVGVGGSP